MILRAASLPFLLMNGQPDRTPRTSTEYFQWIAPSSMVSYLDAATADQLYEALDFLCQGDCDYISILTMPTSAMEGCSKSAAKRKWMKPCSDSAITERELLRFFQHKAHRSAVPSDTDEQCDLSYSFNNLTADRFGGLLSGKPTERDSYRYALGEGLWYESQGLPNP